MYSLEFLHKLLRTMSLLSGVATKQPTAMGLLMQVVTPRGLSTLLALLFRAPPRHKILILRILNSLVQVLPQAVFEQAIKELRSECVSCLVKNLGELKDFNEEDIENGGKVTSLEQAELQLIKTAEGKLFSGQKDSPFGETGEKLPIFFRLMMAYVV